jgi:hypothetical protein
LAVLADELDAIAATPPATVRADLEDVYRDRFAAGGLVHVLEDLHPELSLDRDRLHIDKPHRRRASFDLNGKGIVLLPCAFSWPTLDGAGRGPRCSRR